MTMNYPTVTPRAAKKHGYAPVTDDYDLESKTEVTLLEKAVQQFRGVHIAIVQCGFRASIWRRKEEIA